MEVRIVRRPEMKLVGIKVVGRVQEFSHRVPMAWNDLIGALDAIPHKVSSELFYGVYPESDHQTNGVNGVHTYWVTVEVSQFAELPEGYEAITVPAGEFAVTQIQGQVPQIEQGYTRIFHWIREQGRRTDGAAYGFELYDAKKQSIAPPYTAFDFEIYKPLA